ncbi:MAG TPA: TonB-dependent receptor [Allosphingosinicella sp.]|nr:TonB-dependent receptor [Allosphingosinicella sp.]
MAMTFRSRALRSVAFIGLLGALAPQAYAQETQGTEGTGAGETDDPATLNSEAEIESGQDASAANQGGDITITGSRIRRPNLESTVPITSVGGEEFFETGTVSVGDVLNDLPALKSTFSQSNSTRFLGTAGLNLLDLRGLDTVRTLVLVNGRRHVGSDILNYATGVDVNMIPTDLIERVDLVTGGNSAIYGSDAIAGVVNFVLKRNYDGIQIRGQGGISKYGDAGSYYTSLLAGKNFAGGRGNVAINVEYARQNDFYAPGRPNLRTVKNFVTVDTDPADATSDGTFDNVLYNDIRGAFYAEGGTFLNYEGGSFYSPYNFQRDGTLTRQTGQLVGLPSLGSYIGGDGPTGREGTQVGLSPALDRYSFNMIAHFEVSKAFEPFLEAKFVRTNSVGNASGPFFTGATQGEFFLTDNPFLNPQAREIIRNYYGLEGDDETAFLFYRNIQELTNREEHAQRDTYRIVAGARGQFNDDWSYEVSANYGKFKERTDLLGNVNLQRYLLAIDAVRNPAGQIVCRATIDPSARTIYPGVANNAAAIAYANSTLAGDVAGCVPVNLFGEGNISPEARNYLLEQGSFARGHIKQFVLNGFLSGDTSQFLNLPGGPVGFAIGAEYRKEDAFYTQDQATQSSLTFYNAISDFRPPSFEVKEVFGEIRLPILREVPFFHELTLSAAGRLSDYKGSVGTTKAYNAGIDWAPVRDLRLRANYSRAVRAPNLVDLYFPLSQNFALPLDPCAEDNLGTGSATREANCRAEGVPEGYNFQYFSSLQFLSGGNPDLREETSDSYTVGGVFQPRFIPGLALSVDYYQITVNDVITSLSAQAILNACVDQASNENQFCDLFDRAGPGGGPLGEEPGQVLENNLEVIPLNFAKLKTRGIDAELSYRRKIDGIGAISSKITYTHVLQNDSFLNPIDPGRANQLLLELGEPQDAANFDISLKSGPITVGYQLRYIGKMTTFTYESFFSKQGRVPENPDVAAERFYPAVFYHDARIAIDAGERFNFYVGVDNILNRDPPFGLTGIGAGSGIYSNRGRFFYAGAVAKF